MSSAQVLRNLQGYFNLSRHFQPWIDQEIDKRYHEKRVQRGRRSHAKKMVQVKLGHGGTLDPAATGVLICAIGKGTKSLQTFLECTKTYEATILFGAATDSYDGAGKLMARKPVHMITKENVEKALDKFRGKFKQTPPIFSALNVDGKRLYEYAREGKEVPGGIKERDVDVESLELIEWLEGGTHSLRYPSEATSREKELAEKVLEATTGQPDILPESSASAGAITGSKRKADVDTVDSEEHKRLRTNVDDPLSNGEVERKPDEREDSEAVQEATELELDQGTATEPKGAQKTERLSDWGAEAPAVRLRITSSRGFYVRSLCHDLGKALGSLAFMAALVRTRQGDFELQKNVLEYEDFEKGEEVWSPQLKQTLEAWNARDARSTLAPSSSSPKV